MVIERYDVFCATLFGFKTVESVPSTDVENGLARQVWYSQRAQLASMNVGRFFTLCYDPLAKVDTVPPEFYRLSLFLKILSAVARGSLQCLRPLGCLRLHDIPSFVL
jgi:hypothetical protein